MSEKIGLLADLDLAQWDKAVSSYLASVDKMSARTAAVAGAIASEYSKLGGAIAGAVAGITTAVTGVAVFGAKELTGWTVEGVKGAIELEQKIADIAAVMGETTEAVEPLDRLISDLALNPKLTVDAVGAADAIEMLARNGLTMTDIMAGAAEQTVFLANATKADFGTAADVVTDILGAFNLEVADLGRAVDITSGVVNNSKFTIDDWRLALAQGGGVAGALGVELEDFATIIAGTSTLFGSGSDAGTAFKTMLQRLVPQSNQAADAMRELGLFSGQTGKEFEATQEKIAKIDEQIAKLDPTSKNYAQRLQDLQREQARLRSELNAGSNAFFDANGNMKSGAEISRILWEATKDLSEEQKNAALTTIFGTDALRMAIGVAELGAGSYASFAEQVNAAGQAQQSAETRTATMAAKLEKLGDVMDEIQRQAGRQFFDLLGRIADKLIELASDNSERVVAFFGALADLGETLFDKFEPWVDEQLPKLLDNLEALARWLVEVATTGETNNEWLDKMTPGMRTLVERVLSAIEGFNRFRDTLGRVIDKVQAILTPIANWIAENVELEDALIAATGAVTAFLAPMGLAITKMGLVGAAATLAVSTIRTAWENDFAGIRTKFEEIWPKLQQPVDDLVAKLTQGDWSGAWAAAQTVVTTAIDEIQKHTPKLLTDILEVIQKLVEGDWSGAWEAAKTAAVTALDAMGTAFETGLAAILAWFSPGGGGEAITNWFKENFPESARTAAASLDGLLAGFQMVVDELGRMGQMLVGWWQENDSTIRKIVDELFSGLIAIATVKLQQFALGLRVVRQALEKDWSGMWETLQEIDRLKQEERAINWKMGWGVLNALTEEGIDDIEQTAATSLDELEGTMLEGGSRSMGGFNRGVEAKKEETKRQVAGFGGEVMDEFGKGIERNSGSAVEAFDRAIAEVSGAGSTLPPEFEKTGAQSVGALGTGAESAKGGALGIFDGLADEAHQRMTKLVNFLEMVGEAAISRLAHPIQTKGPIIFGQAIDAVIGGLDNQLNAMQRTFEHHGEQSMMSLAAGMAAGVPVTERTLDNLIDTLVDKFGPMLVRFRDRAEAAMAEMAAGIVNGTDIVVGVMDDASAEVVAVVEDMKESVVELIERMGDEMVESIEGSTEESTRRFESFGKEAHEIVRELTRRVNTAIEEMTRELTRDIENATQSATDRFSRMRQAVSDTVSEMGRQIVAQGQAMKSDFVRAFDDLVNQVVDRFRGLADGVRGAVNVAAFEDIGRNAAGAFVNGLNSRIGEAQAKAQELVNIAAQAAAAAAQIASPSRVFMRLGVLSGEGYLVGLDRILERVRERVTDSLDFGNLDMTVNRIVQQRLATVSASTPALAPVRAVSTVNNMSNNFGPFNVYTPMDWAEMEFRMRRIVRESI